MPVIPTPLKLLKKKKEAAHTVVAQRAIHHYLCLHHLTKSPVQHSFFYAAALVSVSVSVSASLVRQSCKRDGRKTLSTQCRTRDSVSSLASGPCGRRQQPQRTKEGRPGSRGSSCPLQSSPHPVAEAGAGALAKGSGWKRCHSSTGSRSLEALVAGSEAHGESERRHM